MATLSELRKTSAGRPRDKSHYQQLLDAWGRVRKRWPSSLQEAGRDTLLFAVCLAFFYKGQTEYPDVEESGALLTTLTRCARLDPRNHDDCAVALRQLLDLPGVRLARASVLLHCLHPDQFPIVDQNAAKALCDWAESEVGWPDGVPGPAAAAGEATQKATAYLDYRHALLGLARASGLSLREVEFALYNAGRLGKPVTGL